MSFGPVIFMVKQYGNVLFNGFETDISERDRKIHRLTLNHFSLFNQWQKVDDHYIQDLSTKDLYINDSPNTIRLKCLGLFFGTLLGHSIGLALNAINRILKLATLAHFWHPSPTSNYQFKVRILEFVKDIFRVILLPLIFVGLLLAALFGLSYPHDGRKLYTTFEKAAYGSAQKLFRVFDLDKYMDFLLAPCFRPTPVGHFFGGDINRVDVF